MQSPVTFEGIKYFASFTADVPMPTSVSTSPGDTNWSQFWHNPIHFSPWNESQAGQAAEINCLLQLLLPCRSVKAEAAHLALSCSLSTASRWGCGRIKHEGELAYVLQSFRLLLAFLHLLFSLIGLLQAMVTHKKKHITIHKWLIHRQNAPQKDLYRL